MMIRSTNINNNNNNTNNDDNNNNKNCNPQVAPRYRAITSAHYRRAALPSVRNYFINCYYAYNNVYIYIYIHI